MPTILTHAAVPLALGLGLGRRVIPRRLLLAGMAASALPDVDVVSFTLGVARDSALAHRGLTHSLAFAAAVALLGASFHRRLHTQFAVACFFLFIAVASHGFLDAFTNGGWGVMYLWPWSSERFFAPVRLIEVSPIGMRIFSERGVAVLVSEIIWIWLPCAVLVTALALGPGRKR